MQNIKVIMGYIEVTKTTGMVGPLRNAKIKNTGNSISQSIEQAISTPFNRKFGFETQ